MVNRPEWSGNTDSSRMDRNELLSVHVEREGCRVRGLGMTMPTSRRSSANYLVDRELGIYDGTDLVVSMLGRTRAKPIG